MSDQASPDDRGITTSSSAIRVGDTITEGKHLALPVGSVVIDRTGLAWQQASTGAGPLWADATGKPGRISGRLLTIKSGPLVVVYVPGAKPSMATVAEPLVKKGVCLACGSAVLRGEHLRLDCEPCNGRMLTVQEALFTARAEELEDFATTVEDEARDVADLALHRARKIRQECLIRASE